MHTTLPETISADYTLRPSELAEVLALLVKARQPTMVWGPPGAANRQYVDVRALVNCCDAESLCDRSNSRLGLNREAICAIVGRFMEPDFNSTAPQRCAR